LVSAYILNDYYIVYTNIAVIYPFIVEEIIAF
jgi:hypothetical protein